MTSLKAPSREWEACETIGASWGYSKDTRCKSATTLIRMLVEATGMNGNLLLNVGPDGQGAIPAGQIERLQEIGRWMEVNGESIHGCGAAPVPAQKWGRVTAKEGRMYFHIYDWPKDGKLVIENFQGTPEKAWLLAYAKKTVLQTRKLGDTLAVTLPAEAPEGLHAVLCIDVNEATNK